MKQKNNFTFDSQDDLIRATIGFVRFYLFASALKARRCLRQLTGSVSNESKICWHGVPFATAPGRRRILLVASDNNPGSGAFRCLVEVATQIRQSTKYDVAVVLPYDGTGGRLLLERQIPFVVVPSCDWVVNKGWRVSRFHNMKDVVGRILTNHHAISVLVDLIRMYSVDLVHSNTTYTYVGALAAKATGVPHVWHLREFLEEDQGKTIVSREYGNRLIGESVRILTVSRSVRKKYLNFFVSGKLIALYDGVDADRFYCPGHSILNSGSPIFVFLGNYQPQKGQYEFALACAMLYKSGYKDFRVWFVGEGVRESCGRIFEAAGMTEVVTYCGFQKNPELYLHQADVAFVCSKMEAFGLVTVEAMLSGCLVVGADTGCTAELVRDGETGVSFHYTERDGTNIFGAMQNVIANPERMRKMAAYAREYAMKYLSTKINAELIMSEYDSIMASKS